MPYTTERGVMLEVNSQTKVRVNASGIFRVNIKDPLKFANLNDPVIVYENAERGIWVIALAGTSLDAERAKPRDLE